MRLPCNIHKLRGVGVVVTVATKPIHCSSVSSRALSNQCHATMSNSHSYADVVCELATLMFTCITITHRLKLRFAVSGSGMRYALYGKNGKACKRTRVIPYVRIRHAICRAAANGCVCGKLNRSMYRLMWQKGTKSDGGSWGILECDVRVGCFISLRQICQKAKYRREKQNTAH